mgnify:CR=1 FL=1
MRKEFRLTRCMLYSDPKCLGHDDLTARQGHYIQAESELEARKQMLVMFPRDDGWFTCNVWKE